MNLPSVITDSIPGTLSMMTSIDVVIPPHTYTQSQMEIVGMLGYHHWKKSMVIQRTLSCFSLSLVSSCILAGSSSWFCHF